MGDHELSVLMDLRLSDGVLITTDMQLIIIGTDLPPYHCYMLYTTLGAFVSNAVIYPKPALTAHAQNLRSAPYNMSCTTIFLFVSTQFYTSAHKAESAKKG